MGSKGKLTSFVIGAIIGASIVKYKDKLVAWGTCAYNFCKEKMQKSSEKVTEEVTNNE
jgi:hypothetical protein